MRIYDEPKRRQRVCIDTDEIQRNSKLSITPSWMTRFWSLFRGATYRVVISHRGPIDKLTLSLNDEEIYALVPLND